MQTYNGECCGRVGVVRIVNEMRLEGWEAVEMCLPEEGCQAPRPASKAEAPTPKDWF